MPPTRQTACAGRGRRASPAVLLCASFALCLVSVPLACSLGPVAIPFSDVLSALLSLPGGRELPGTAVPAGLPDMEAVRLVVQDIRLPRVLLALGSGAGLAVAGTVFQGILRNPLADPFTLGVSGGAAFGAALAISLGLSGAVFGFGIPLAAFVGALLSLLAVLALGRIGGGLRHETLILAGVVVSALLAALIALVKALDESSVTGIVFWIMGSFQGRGWPELLLLLPGLCCGGFLSLALHARLDMLSLGDRTARHLGLSAARIRLILLLAAGAITASCVAVAGIIGFIGLIVPHLCRMLLGAAHKALLPASALCGALLLLWSDVAARSLLPGGVELPVGVVTALLGGPFFCFILGKRQDCRRNSPKDAISPPSGPERTGTPESPSTLPAPDGLPVSCRNLCFGYAKKKPEQLRAAPGLSSSPERRNALPEARVLTDISFSLQAGEFVGLLGPNASGKSTLLNCLSGILPLWQGEARIFGQNARALKDKQRARLLAQLPQKPESVPALSASDLVLMGRYAHTPFLGGYSRTDKEKALLALKETGAAHLAGRPADALSGGELQRVLLARALAQETPLLFLDEAPAGLDPAFQIAVLDTLARKNSMRKLTILAAMHELNLAALYCSRLIFLKQGRIAADGPLREVFTSEVLGMVYECPVRILEHPDNGRPQALLLPGA